MSAADDELAQIRAARQAEIQQQIESQAEQQMQAEAQEAAAEEEADGSSNQRESTYIICREVVESGGDKVQ